MRGQATVLTAILALGSSCGSEKDLSGESIAASEVTGAIDTRQEPNTLEELTQEAINCRAEADRILLSLRVLDGKPPQVEVNGWVYDTRREVSLLEGRYFEAVDAARTHMTGEEFKTYLEDLQDRSWDLTYKLRDADKKR